MPNLTSYQAPSLHLHRELPKTYCDLIRHEIDYNHFLRTRIANVQSSLSSSSQNHHPVTNDKLQRQRYFDHNQRLPNVYADNLHLCKKILQIWSHNGKRKGGVDCHNENYRKQLNISHFRLRDKRWKDRVENDNKRFIRSMAYHRKNYRPMHDRLVAQEAFEHHSKLLKTLSQYPKYTLSNPIYKTLLNHQDFPEHVYYNYNQFYAVQIPVQCRTLPRSYKVKQQTSPKVSKKFNKSLKSNELKRTNRHSPSSTTHLENVLQQTINDAIHIYNQPLPSVSHRIKSSCSENNQWLKPRFYHSRELFPSVSCRQLLEPWRHTKQERGPLGSYTINDNIFHEKSRFLPAYNLIQQQHSSQ